MGNVLLLLFQIGLNLTLWALIIGVATPLYSIVLLPLCAYRLLVNLVVKLKKPAFLVTLNSRDLTFISDSFFDKPRKSVVNVSIMDGDVDLETVRTAIRVRLLEKQDFIKLTCRPVTFGGYWFLEKIPDFKVSDHVSSIPEVLSDDDMRTWLPNYAQMPFIPGGPLWAACLVKMTGNRTALMIKLHHMIGDGVSFMTLLELFSDGNWTNIEKKKVRSFTFAHWVYAWFWFPYSSSYSYYLATMKACRPKKKRGSAYCAYSILDLEKIRVIRRKNKCLFSSVLAGLLSSCLDQTLQDKIEELRMVVPAPWPGRKYILTNHVAWLHAKLTVCRNTLKTMNEFEKRLKMSYKSGLHGIMWQTFRGLYILPGPILRAYCSWGERNLPPVVLSSIPGSLNSVNLFGKKVLHSFPILALGCRTGVNACVTTYAEGAYFSIRVSHELMASQAKLDEFVKLFENELDMLYNEVIKEDEESTKNHCALTIAIP